MKRTKKCPDCDHKKSVRHFPKNICNPDGLSTYCDEHNLKRVQTWKLANPKKLKAQRERYIARIKARNLARGV